MRKTINEQKEIFYVQKTISLFVIEIMKEPIKISMEEPGLRHQYLR
jgi:hypothetical protein